MAIIIFRYTRQEVYWESTMTYPTEHSPNTIYAEGEQFAGLTGRRRKQLMLLHCSIGRSTDLSMRRGPHRYSTSISNAHVAFLPRSPIAGGLPVCDGAGT